MTPNQKILLEAVLTAPRTTAQLADLHKDDGGPFGEDAARAAMKRLEKKGLVSGDGHGTQRVWCAVTILAREALGLPQESSPDSGWRGYVVLEEATLAEAVRGALPPDWKPSLAFGAAGALEEVLEALDGRVVYDKVTEVSARNTDAAYRQAAKEHYVDSDSAPTLVAIAEKQWRPTKVRVQTRQTVSVG